MNRGGQLKLSFGMIFSIILIIVFVAFAFYAIGMILDFQGTASVGGFVNDLQKDVDKMWAGSGGSQGYKYNLPDDINEICFDEENRISFKPFGEGGEFEDREIKHLDKSISFCIDNVEGVKIRIKKDEGESLVSIEAGE
jgi:hypothetical protein